MKTCPVCGFHNLDSRERCLKCSAALDGMAPAPEPRPLARSRAGRVVTHLADRALLPLAGLRHAAGRLGRALAVSLPEDLDYRNPYAAGLLGLVPGLGQLHNHQPRKTLYFLLALPPLLILTVYHIRTPYLGNLMLVLCVALSMGSFTDAFLTAARINGQEFVLRNIVAALLYPWAMLSFFGVAMTLMNTLQWPVMTHFRISGGYMAPALQPGDQIFGEGLSYLVRAPRPGEVVRYDPPGYAVNVQGPLNSDRYLVDAQNGFERVMAVGGETLEYREGRFFVDGRALSRDYYPLVTGQMFPRFTLRCPPGHFIVLISARARDESIINLLQSLGGNSTEVPDFNAPGVTVEGWHEACIVTKEAIFDRSICIVLPGPRRQWLGASGSRFVEGD